jgi:hypothetical protein
MPTVTRRGLSIDCLTSAITHHRIAFLSFVAIGAPDFGENSAQLVHHRPVAIITNLVHHSAVCVCGIEYPNSSYLLVVVHYQLQQLHKELTSLEKENEDLKQALTFERQTRFLSYPDDHIYCIVAPLLSTVRSPRPDFAFYDYDIDLFNDVDVF